MRVDELRIGTHFKDCEIENANFQIFDERKYIVYNTDKTFVAIANDIGNGNGVVTGVLTGEEAADYIDNVLNKSKQLEGDTMEQNERPVYQVVGDTPVLGIWFKTIGQEKFIVEAKIFTIPDHSEKEVLHISEILDAYVANKYGTPIEWNGFGDAYLVLRGVTFLLKRVGELIGSEEADELFEYRAEKAEKIIRACIENIDEVYHRENVVEDIKFTI